MIQDKIFFDEKDPTGLSYNTPFTYYGSYQGRLWSKSPSGSIQYYTQNSDLSAYATTGSNQFSGSQTITGSLTVTGTITGTVAGTTATASYVEYTNVANKPALISGSSQVTYSGLTGIPAGIVSGSEQVTYSGLTGIPSGIVSGSSQIAALGFATTGSNTFQADQVITGSLFISQNLVVAGSSSIQYISSSVLDIADNTITVNTFNPSVRFGGLGVIDSGSSPQVSGSMLFDSIKDQWIFVHQNQSVVTSSVVLMGPETYNDLGNESYISANRLPKGSGVEHLRDSNISDTGTVVSVNSNTQITGSLNVSSTGVFSSNVTSTQYTATSTGGSGLRVYGAAGTNQWDMYLNSANIRFSDNTGGGRFVVDSPSTLSTTLFSSTSIYQVSIKSTGAQYLLVGSENASGAGIILDGDSNGDGAGGDYSYIVHDSSGALHIVQDSPSGTNDIRFGTAGTENKVVINSSGNLGVGLTSPGYKIEVAGADSQYWNGTAFTGTPLALAISNTTAGGYDPVLILQQADSGGTTKNAGAIGLVGRASWTAGNNATQISDMYFLVRNSSGGISERMRITSGGNVLVNTTSVASLGNGIVLRGDNNGVGGYGYIQISGTGSTTRGIYLYNTNGLVGAVGTDGTSLLFATGGSDTERMRITSGGVVRITNFTSNGLVGTDASGNLGVVNNTYTEIATGTITYSMTAGAPWGINNSFPATIRNYDDDLMAGSAGGSTSLTNLRGVTFDLGSAKAVRKIVERGYPTKNLDNITVQYSTDNSNWTTIHTYRHVYGNVQKNMEFNPTGAISARYWRWLIDGWTETREVQNYYTYESIIYT